MSPEDVAPYAAEVAGGAEALAEHRTFWTLVLLFAALGAVLVSLTETR